MRFEISSPLWARAEAWFFHHFFLFLLFWVSVAQAGVVWWIARQWTPLSGLHFFAVATLLGGFNFWLVRRRRNTQRQLMDRLPQLYHAAAFTCLFVAGFLVLNHLIWQGGNFLHAMLTSEARGMGTTKRPLRAGPLDERATGWLGLMGIVGLFGYGYTLGQRRLQVARISVPCARWPATTPPLRLVQLSDIHVGTNMRVDELQGFVARVNALEPDLICITGDIADNARSDLDKYFPVLASLRARYGVVAILGNHDHYAGAERVATALRRHTDFTVLRDEVFPLHLAGGRLHVIGLDDRGLDWARGVPHVPQLETLCRALPEEDPKLLLCHRPDVFPQAAALGIDLVLSGHTHGGQIALPWFSGRRMSLAQLITRFDRGLFRRGDSLLYVNCGLGVTGQRIRLWTPREITMIELRAAATRESFSS
ncbi:MAG: metallophosphoesterase [Candidatus Binatia bacterium]|nr:metallophosphoesterase [Candidatus Binatia bacterium]